MTISMKQIARMADVHESTVSKVLNNYTDVGSGTARRIMEIARREGYQKNQSAVRLSKRRTFSIGVAMRSGMSSYQSMEVLRGIGETVNSYEANRYDIILLFPKGSPAKHTYREFFRQKRMDGIIIVFPDSATRGIRELEEDRAPAVLANSKSGVLDYVDNDNAGGAEKMMEHLIGCGYRRIGVIKRSDSLVDFNERYGAYRGMLEKHGLEYLPGLDIADEFTGEAHEGYIPMQKMIKHKPDAVFALSDALALGAMQAIRDAGLDIPGDIAVAGYDDSARAATAVPPLTTVRQPLYRVGVESANILLAKLDGDPERHRRVILPTEVVVRESTANIKGH